LLILRQISEGLQYLHNEYRNDNGLIIRPSIAHRDLKSDNILYLNSNRLVICDFAMSTKIEQNQNSPNQEQQVFFYLF
jgi:serine/threonine protein kinase